MDAALKRVQAAPPTFAELFTPKLITVFREGYGLADLKADALAGLTVAIVALPLSMAIAIASGVAPERGLYTAIVGGFLVSLLGGSRFQIGGPAGAFIVVVAAIVQRDGYDGLVLAMLVASLILVATGLLRLGTFIKYIPYPVTLGFTAGIAVIIFASQLSELLGLYLRDEPSAILPKLNALWIALPSANPATIAVSLVSLATILGLNRWRPKWPGFLIAVGLAAAVSTAFHLDVATVGSRFGGVPSALPHAALPAFTWDKLQSALSNGCTIALLAAIESLLSAVVADGMTGRRHRSNCELVAQGVANGAAALFGGICVTGLVARTATNIRARARGPLAGIFQALYMLVFVLVAAPLASYIPLASLGAVLAVVAWNMAEKTEIWALLRSSRGDATVLFITFLLTVFVDLATGIAVGVVLGAFLFLHRMADAVEVQSGTPLVVEDRGDFDEPRTAYDPAVASNPDVMVYRISGALFFGATAALSTVLDRVGPYPKAFILDFEAVPLIDSTAANALRGFVQKLERLNVGIYFAGVRENVQRTLLAAGMQEPTVHYVENARAAMAPRQ